MVAEGLSRINGAIHKEMGKRSSNSGFQSERSGKLPSLHFPDRARCPDYKNRQDACVTLGDRAFIDIALRQNHSCEFVSFVVTPLLSFNLRLASTGAGAV